MNSLYLKNIFKKNSFRLNDIKNKKYKYYYTPYIGYLEENKRYIIPKKIFIESKLFYGNDKIIKINKLLYIQINNNVFNRKKWYISTIINIIKTYEKKFNYKIKIPIFVQINEYNKYKSGMFDGGFASYQGIELILYKDIEQSINKIKWTLSHELLHLFFPSINSKYATCWNEGFVDYLSLILNFSQTEINVLFNNSIEQYSYIKSLDNKNNLKQQYPYIRGLLYGFLMNESNLKKTISFIQKYLKERNNNCVAIPWKNKEYYNFVKNNLFIDTDCTQYINYNINY